MRYIPLHKEKVLTRAGYIGLQMRINEQMGRGLSIAGRDILVGHLTLLAASNATDWDVAVKTSEVSYKKSIFWQEHVWSVFRIIKVDRGKKISSPDDSPYEEKAVQNV